ncbi:MAG: HAMP domain-containing histidine kinase [Lachnospiraceae bacterium]|nr:HAMP domain-containing histidine kinase [Lachnospiraceae bacterium]
MKIWQKVYLTTLVVFLVMLNAGLLLAANYIFKHNLEIEEQQCERESYFLEQNLTHDFSILEKNGRMQETFINAVVAGYQNYYQSQDINITLTKEDAEKVDGVFSRAWAVQGGRRIYVAVYRSLAEPYEEYTLTYQKELVDFEETWALLLMTFVLISLVLSLLLCVLLLFMMHQMFKPLEKLNESVAEISRGNYEQHLEHKGEDEIAELAENINMMSDTIQGQISMLEDENAKKQQLMDNLAHELRTPLTSIYGYAELLQRGKLTEEEVYEGLSYIMRESKRLNKMSEELLSMRLLEQENVEYTKLSMDDISEHLRKILTEKLEAKKVQLEERHELGSFWGEEYLYIVLFRNLLENAIRASYEGGNVKFQSSKRDEEYCFEIIDRGIGMDEDELSKIMDAFYRVDKGRARVEGGVGLGLSIVNVIVAKLNGRIEFETKQGEGTKVIVWIQPPKDLGKEAV